MSKDYEDYEVIPTSPIRRLEKRLSKIEDSSSGSSVQRLIEQIIELIKSNQRVIDDVIKADAELRNELSKVPSKIDDLVESMDEFISLLKESAVNEHAASGSSVESMKPLVEKITELVDQNKKLVESNDASLASLGIIDKRLKRLYLQFASMYKR